MTDKEIFEQFMGWMCMTPREIQTEEGLLIEFKEDMDTPSTKNFTSQGYDEFYAGALFNEQGEMIKGYMDSHVAYESRNAKELDKLETITN